MHTTSAACLLVTLLALAGCAGDPPAAPESATEGATQEPTDGDAPCIEGTWSLDLDDYTGQAAVYLKSIGIPLNSLTSEGSQTLQVHAGTDPVITENTNIAWSAVVLDNPVEVQTSSTGHGEWGFGATPSTIEVDNWFWEAEAAVPGADAPTIPIIDPSNGLNADCSGDVLTLSSPDAPLIGRFTRMP